VPHWAAAAAAAPNLPLLLLLRLLLLVLQLLLAVLLLLCSPDSLLPFQALLDQRLVPAPLKLPGQCTQNCSLQHQLWQMDCTGVLLALAWEMHGVLSLLLLLLQ
jgi:hypothetical protein